MCQRGSPVISWMNWARPCLWSPLWILLSRYALCEIINAYKIRWRSLEERPVMLIQGSLTVNINFFLFLSSEPTSKISIKWLKYLRGYKMKTHFHLENQWGLLGGGGTQFSSVWSLNNMNTKTDGRCGGRETLTEVSLRKGMRPEKVWGTVHNSECLGMDSVICSRSLWMAVASSNMGMVLLSQSHCPHLHISICCPN